MCEVICDKKDICTSYHKHCHNCQRNKGKQNYYVPEPVPDYVPPYWISCTPSYTLWTTSGTDTYTGSYTGNYYVEVNQQDEH